MVAPQEGVLPKPAFARFALAGLVAVLLLAACSDRVPAPATQTPSPSASASPAPSVTRLPLGLPALTLAPAVALPPDIALLLETGCFGCDGPATGLIRVTRSAAGVSGRDLLLSAGAHKLYGDDDAVQLYFAGDVPIPREMVDTSKGLQQYDPHVTGIATGYDGSEIVVSVCVYPGCGVGMDAWSPDGRVALYRSVDGGETWADFGTIDGGGVLGIVSPGTILALSPIGPDGPPDVFLYPGHELVAHPPTAQGVFHPPVVLADGTIAWPNWGGSLQRADGSLIVDLPDLAGVFGPFDISSVVQQPFGHHLIAVQWADSGAGGTTFLSLFDSEGAHLRTFSVDRFLLLGTWVSGTAIAGNVGVEADELAGNIPEFFPGLLPALIDIEAGMISPIVDPFLEAGAEMGRNYVRGVQLGSASP
jgi:hypothetical protein